MLATAAALVSPIPLLVGIVAEVAYLLFVPDSKWFAQRLETKFDAEVISRREALKKQVFAQVRPDIMVKFSRLEEARSMIEGQARKENKWFREALRKLDFLMEKYLVFAAKEAQFCNYLTTLVDESRDKMTSDQRRRVGQTSKAELKTRETFAPTREAAPPTWDVASKYATVPQFIVPTEKWVQNTVEVIQEHHSDEISDLGKRTEEESVLATRSILVKRKEVLERRHQFVGRIGQILSNLGHQMELMSDTFGLINDEIRARSPEQVLADIDEVVLTTTSLTEAIDEITPTDELVGNHL